MKNKPSKTDLRAVFSYLGKRRAQALTPERRSEIAKKASDTRWSHKRKAVAEAATNCELRATGI